MTVAKRDTMTKTKVIITTAHRGVFVGDVADTTLPDSKTVKMENMRCVIYWGTARGLWQLCQSGPSDKTKLSDACPRCQIGDVTGVFELTASAREAFGRVE